MLTYVIRRLLDSTVVLSAASVLVFTGMSLVTSPVGMGLYFITQLNAGDAYPVMAFLMVTAVFVVTFNLLADLAYGWLDSRVRLG